MPVPRMLRPRGKPRLTGALKKPRVARFKAFLAKKCPPTSVKSPGGETVRFSPRRALARGFPYSVVYLDEPERVWIVAVMHAKRRLGYWRERLGEMGEGHLQISSAFDSDGVHYEGGLA